MVLNLIIFLKWQLRNLPYIAFSLELHHKPHSHSVSNQELVVLQAPYFRPFCRCSKREHLVYHTFVHLARILVLADKGPWFHFALVVVDQLRKRNGSTSGRFSWISMEHKLCACHREQPLKESWNIYWLPTCWWKDFAMLLWRRNPWSISLFRTCTQSRLIWHMAFGFHLSAWQPHSMASLHSTARTCCEACFQKEQI